MKHISLLLMGIILMSGCGRMTRVPEDKRAIRKVFEVNLPRKEIYSRALEWCAKRFSDVKEDIVVRDAEKGTIIARGVGKYSEYFDLLVDREFSYSMTVETKDTRYRVTFDNFTVYYDERQMKSGKAEYRFELDKIAKKLERDMNGLHEYISRGATGEKDKQKSGEDW
ncbi:MAG: DUF4468 domain-containing protein [Spirochaetes bacterium]|nr:DUF4468 domain-containing protein [Spirochaetota bacterium]